MPTAHRRFSEWAKAGLWRRLHRAVLDELGGQGMIDWSRAVLDGASVRAKKGERSIAWLFGYHRLGIRYDRYANHFCAFLTLAATLT